MKPPEILFDLHSGKNSESNPHILKDDFRKMQSRYKNYQQIYMDGSKEDSEVGCAVKSDNHSNIQHIPDDSSIFTAEAKAVDLALDFISTCDANNKFIIFSDSLSVLKAMNHTSSKNPQIQKLLEKCHELFLSPYIYSEVNHKRHFIKIPFINKGIEFIDLHSIFKDNSVISSIPNYFNNSETPIICYKYLLFASQVLMKSKARSTALASAVKIDESSGICCILLWLSDLTLIKL